MRKIICFTHSTLDGHNDDPHLWPYQYYGEDLQAVGLEMTLGAETLRPALSAIGVN
jgi:hypothetical protein